MAEEINKLTRNDLVRFLAARDKQSYSMTDNTVKRVLSGIVELLQQKAVDGLPLTMNLPHFGSFKIKVAEERVARNPSTGEVVKVPARPRLLFQAGKEFKGIIREAGK